MGHEAIICRNERQQNEEEAKAVDKEKEDYFFVDTCFTSIVQQTVGLLSVVTPTT